MKMKKMKNSKLLRAELIDLLKIHSSSGNEVGVITYLFPKLKRLLDSVNLDSYGNIMAILKLGPDPYTVLLNAHMDTVALRRPVVHWEPTTDIIRTSSDDALGGDDKCGIAIILEVLRHVKYTKFNGTIKVLFTREEEIGCVGASCAVRENSAWFQDVDVDVTIDRKGSHDIITETYGQKFCSPNYEKFWVDMLELGEPQCGSISDTMIFAEFGINSVNLSAGYYNAHTPAEYVVVPETYATSQGVLRALNNIQAYGQFPEFNYRTSSIQPSWDDWKQCDYCGIWEPVSNLHYIGKNLTCNNCYFPTEDEEGNL